jgi:hypothetical protein
MTRPQYVETSAFVQYAASCGIVVTDAEATILITRAQNYLDGAYKYKGYRVSVDSAFPRYDLKNYTHLEIPAPITEATKIIALLLAQNVPIEAGSAPDAKVSKEVIATGRIEVQYATDYQAPQTQNAKLIPSVTNLLREYCLIDFDSFNGVNLTAIRG